MKKEKFIEEIKAFTRDEQVEGAMERVKNFPIPNWTEIMEHIKTSLYSNPVGQARRNQKEIWS